MTKQGCADKSKPVSVKKADVERIVRALESIGIGNERNEPKEYGYANLVLCIIDAVFSLREPYNQVLRTVCNFVSYWDSHYATTTAKSPALTLKRFLAEVKAFTPKQLAENVFKDRHQAPGCMNLLKAQVVVNLANRLLDAGIETPADVMNPQNTNALKSAVLETKGIGQAGYSYLRMLSGDEDEAKPDKWIIQFSTDVLGRALDGAESVALLRAATKILKEEYPSLNLRAVDHFIWISMSNGIDKSGC